MWCSACQQDVAPKRLPDSEAGLCCGKCGRLLTQPTSERGTAPAPAPRATDGHAAAGAVTSGAATGSATATPDENAAFEQHLIDQLGPQVDWELEFQMAGVRQLIASLQRCALAQSPSDERAFAEASVDERRIAELPSYEPDPPVALKSSDAPRAVSSRQTSLATTHPKVGPSGGTLGHWLTWSTVGLGLGLLACGSVLLVWSVAASRDDLWSPGLALAALGQGVLLASLIGQLASESPAKIVTR